MAYTGSEYGDIFCQAVQNIVNQSISQLEFDISRECTIIKIIDKAYGEYQVSDGSITFTAIADEGSHFEVGDRVMVNIPSGNYNKQISILTKIVDEWSGPAGFMRPLDTIIRCTDNIAISAPERALTANGEIESIPVLELTNQRFFGFQKIGISAKFKSLINGLNVVDGSYGLRFSLIELDKNAKNDNGESIRKEKSVKQFLFSSDYMLGNPYEFSTYFTQEYAFDIPEGFDEIHEIKIDFYQNKQFKNGNGEEIIPIPGNKENTFIENLFVKDLEVYFGYDINKNLDEIVEIRSEHLTYSSNIQKHIELSWFHKVSENKMQKIDNTFDSNLYGVRWYKYISGCAEANTDEYGGANWFLLNPPKEGSLDLAGNLLDKYPFTTMVPVALIDFPFSLEAPLLDTKEQEQFKAVCLMKTFPLINDPTYAVIQRWTSNILTFENTNEETAGGESVGEVIRKDLSLVFSDNSYGNYFVYDQNGEIINLSDGQRKNRSLMLRYKDAEINEDNFLDITKIEWSLPKLGNSMITYNNKQHENNKVPKEFTYQILDDLDTSLSDNTISCFIYVSGQLYATLNETLRFGKRGSNGTTTTFILEMLDGKNALVPPYYSPIEANEDNYKNYYKDDGAKVEDNESFDKNETYYELVKSLRIQAILIRDTGKLIYLTDNEKAKIQWELLNNDSEYISLAQNSNNVDKDWITLNLNNDTGNEYTIPNDNYTILKASYKYEDDGPTLETYLPIPIRHKDYNKFIGETQVIYNHQGIPKYSNSPYAIKIKDNTGKIISITSGWELKQLDSNLNPLTLKKISGGKGLSATALYSKRQGDDSAIQDGACVYCDIGTKEDPNIIWSQPILVMQSQYDFTMLNEWDGSLTIDEKNGTILSTMLGAGRKDDQNRFSGVLIGDIQKGTQLNDTETLTGVYGFQNGIVTYGLKENGKAFFGAYANGRIEIDGTSGIIRSAGWIKSEENESWKLNPKEGQPGHDKNISVRTAGTLIDLDDGMLLMEAGNENYFRFNSNNSGKLEMSLSGLNIILNDKEKSLSGYIDVTAEGLTSEFRKTANYSCTAIEDKSVDSNNFRRWVLSEIQTGDSINDIYHTGVTLAITFTEDYPEHNREYGRPFWIVDSRKEGSFEDNDGNEIKVSAKPLFYKNNVATMPKGNNPFTWEKDDVIYVSYDEELEATIGGENGWKCFGGWKIIDSGSYSKIKQTATEIRTEVGDLDNRLTSSITQTANSITSEVRRTAGYGCTAMKSENRNGYWNIILANSEYDWDNIKQTGVTIAVTFNEALTSNNSIWFNCNGNWHAVFYGGIQTSKSNPLNWTANNVMYFCYDASLEAYGSNNTLYQGGWQVVDSGAYSKITQLSDSINAEVLATNGTGNNKGFKWTLTADGFSLGSKVGNTNYTTVFNCTHDGLTIKPKTFELVSGSWANGMIQLKTNPSSSTDYYFGVGTTNDYMRFSKNDGLETKMSNFNLTSGSWENGYLGLNSNPVKDSDYYFGVGNNTNYMCFSKSGGLEIKTSNFNLASGSWEKGYLALNNDNYYFATGNNDNYITFKKDGTFNLKAGGLSYINGQLTVPQIDTSNFVTKNGIFSGTLSATSGTFTKLSCTGYNGILLDRVFISGFGGSVSFKWDSALGSHANVVIGTLYVDRIEVDDLLYKTMTKIS